MSSLIGDHYCAECSSRPALWRLGDENLCHNCYDAATEDKEITTASRERQQAALAEGATG